MKFFKILIILNFTYLISFNYLYGQNTVGTILNTTDSFNGYSLFTFNTETYLINNCGEVTNQWTSPNKSGKSVYLLENGDLLRAAEISNPGNISIPGVGGRIELFDWNGNLKWGFDYSSINHIQHHDIYPLPNGNVLILAATILTEAEAIQLGRDPAKLINDPTNGIQLYNEQILEIQPVGTNSANIVWQWDIKDHLIQNFDSSKDNFAVIEDNPQLLDVNFLGLSGGKANWLHVNSLQYNADLDQIILSSRHLSEIYIIDHSTTIAESATHLGGTYGKGGDILYRWGNPQIYGQGTLAEQKLDGQHHPHWIPNGLNDAGKIILFNNGFTRSPGFSEIFVLSPPTSAPGVYTYTTNTAYGPSSPDYIYTAPINTDFYSPILSSVQRLPNGNTLICEGTSGHFFEIDTNENIVWDYVNPVTNTGILSQGDDPDAITVHNNVFRVAKYATDYQGFNGKDLTPGNPLELNPDLSQCTILGIADNNLNNMSLFPNPVNDVLFINSSNTIDRIEIYDLLGKLVKTSYTQDQIDLRHLESGVYIVKLYNDNHITVKKIIKTRLK
jgi:hypothetical protein